MEAFESIVTPEASNLATAKTSSIVAQENVIMETLGLLETAAPSLPIQLLSLRVWPLQATNWIEMPEDEKHRRKTKGKQRKICTN